ncbi:histidine kinase [Pseudarcicella hirudinis]
MFLSVNYWLFFGVYALVFYLNILYLIPQFYFKRKYTIYFGSIFLIFCFANFFQPFENLIFQEFHGGEGHHERFPPAHEFGGHFDGHTPPPMPPAQRSSVPKMDVISIFLFGMLWALGMALKISEEWRLSEQKVISAESDKINAELSFLKAQINPHFLFNTLNNIYSLAVENHQNTAASIMKLSQIMRYVTDEVSEDFVPLSSEIDCISNYIDLQKLRLNKKTVVDFQVFGNAGLKKITPLVLMTFVENAFKHGVSNHEASTIEIKLYSEKNAITFICRNAVFASQRKTERDGIGITNTQKRLNHLYPDKHCLNIGRENDFYKVELLLED